MVCCDAEIKLHRVIRSLPALVRFASALELNRHVANLEVVLKLVADAPEKFIINRSIGFHQMDGQSCLGRAHGPNVQIVNLGHAG